MTVIRREDIARQVEHGIDPSGILFHYEERLLRAFSGDEAAMVSEFLAMDECESLFSLGLVRFRPAEITLEGFDLVVEVDRVPVRSYAPEWPTRMLAEAALLLLRLARALHKLGFVLKDAHPWNVLFDGTRPVFVDIGSIQRLSDSSVSFAWLAELRRHLLVPLALHSVGAHGLADAVVREHRPLGAKGLFDVSLVRHMLPLGVSLRYLRNRRDPERLYGSLIQWVEGLDTQGRKMSWSNYDQKEIAVGQQEDYDPKKRAVDDFLKQLPPGRVVDVAANMGWFSELACSYGHEVTAFDVDDRALGVLYQRAVDGSLPVLPLRMDVVWPQGSYGMGLAYADAYERIQGDTVMAVAILHHLARNYGVRFEFVARVFDRLARDAAIVEFIPREDVHVAKWPLAQEGWYHMDGLIAAMRPYFPRVSVLPSSPEPRRMLLFQRAEAT
jgi:hypothetical protein